MKLQFDYSRGRVFLLDKIVIYGNLRDKTIFTHLLISNISYSQMTIDHNYIDLYTHNYGTDHNTYHLSRSPLADC